MGVKLAISNLSCENVEGGVLWGVVVFLGGGVKIKCLEKNFLSGKVMLLGTVLLFTVARFRVGRKVFVEGSDTKEGFVKFWENLFVQI